MTLDHPLLLALGLAASATVVPCSDGDRDAYGAPNAAFRPCLAPQAGPGGGVSVSDRGVAPHGRSSGAWLRGVVLAADTSTPHDADRALPEGATAVRVTHPSHAPASAESGPGDADARVPPRRVAGGDAASGCLACHGRPAFAARFAPSPHS